MDFEKNERYSTCVLKLISLHVNISGTNISPYSINRSLTLYILILL